MGYILPVQHLTYNDYQQRIKPSKKDHYNIRGPYPVVMNNEHEAYLPRFSHEQKKMNQVTNQLPDHRGEGQYINTYV